MPNYFVKYPLNNLLAMDPNKLIELMIVVEVNKSDRVYCQAEHCKHTVYKQIHVVRDNGRLTLYGSSCFKKKFHDLPTEFKIPKYSSRSSGSVLSDEERRMLINNTEKLLEVFRQEFEQSERTRVALQAKEEKERLASEGIESAMSSVRIASNKWHQHRPSSYQANSVNENAVKNTQTGNLRDEISELVPMCKNLNPQFSEEQLMRSMWAEKRDVANDNIQEYANGANRSQVIDVIIRSLNVGTRSDPWGFAVNLQLNYSIPKIVTFQVLSDFSLIRTVQIAGS